MTTSAPPRPPSPATSDGRPLERQEIEALVEALIEEARRETRRRRRRYGATAVLATLVALAAFMLFDRTAQSQTASPTLAASPSVTLRGRVRIEVKGTDLRGHFTIFGAIRDRGKFVDSDDGPTWHRTLIGAKGTIWIEVGFAPAPRCGCNWRITKGTGEYAGLRGRGREQGRYEGHSEAGFSPITHLTMTGTVWR